MLPSLNTVFFLLFNGLIWGTIIALISIGLSLIFGVMGIVNIAHGEFYMIGAVLAYYVSLEFGNFWLSLIIVPVVVAAIAAPTERYILRGSEGYPSATMITTLGIAFILQQFVLATYGGIPKKLSDPWPVNLHLFGVNYPGYRLVIACISILILIGLWVFLFRTSYGISIRASIQNREMACAMGIDVNKVLVITFALGSVLAAIGGVLAAPVSQVFYLMGSDVMLLSFIVVIVGGLGSLKGTFLAALLFCSLEGVIASTLSPTQARAAIFVIMIIILIRFPRGLFGTVEK